MSGPGTGKNQAESGSTSILSRIVPDVVRRRYTLKFALVVAIMGVTIGVLGATATGVVSQQVEQNVEEEYRNLASQQANTLETWIERNSISVTLASKNDALSNTEPGARFDIRSELATTDGNVYGVNAIYLLNVSDSGTRVVASPQLIADRQLNQTRRAWVGEAPFDAIDVMDVHVTTVHRIGDMPVVAFVSPVTGHPDRYLVMEYSITDLTMSLDTDTEDRVTMVVNDEGTIQATNDGDRIPGRDQYGNGTAMRPVRLASELEGTDQKAGVIPNMAPDETILNEEYTVGYAPAKVSNVNLNWTVLVHEPRSNVFGFMLAISRWGKIATVGAILLVGLFGTAIGYNTTRDINRLRHWAHRMREGDLETTKRTTRIDAIGELYDGFEDMRRSLRQQIREVERARKEAEVSRAEAMRMNEYLQQKAEEYSRTMRRCADGDLTQRLEPDGESDSMDRIATSFNEMLAELERATGQLKRFAIEVENTGELLQTSSDSVRVASGHVADSVQRIADDADEQKEQLQEISREIDDLAAAYETLAEHGDDDVQEHGERLDEIAARISEIATLSEETLAESGIVAGAAEEQAAELTEISDRARDLTQYARPLRDALDEFETETDTDLYADD
ncbi:Methyl-accepting chemotaxis protein [Halapricum desulfuricans]|uniref:Methyl-accepting chemotaxis protein n=1 Tax=Halapricum desulfuricans TaxID=2841257 RepID=A0A897NE67_9EURY|nr:HAMP domain-containing protein [Halapricum desulfuricans]QSG10977.1 Methyl-accepting chemotaxis protein [Halapricum desulfuricans]